MAHLIIGAGNMGKRHANILLDLHQVVELVDLEFDPKTYKWGKWKPESVLICTPAETHATLINLIPPEIPTFCEKPLLVSLKQKIGHRISPTLMACNWLWCRCIRKARTVILFYPSNDQYRNLDILHFYLLQQGKIKIGKDCIAINGKRHFSIAFDKGQPTTHIYTNKPQQIHLNGPCNMFKDQMKHWLNVVAGKEKSRLSFLQAEQLNRELLRRLE